MQYIFALEDITVSISHKEHHFLKKCSVVATIQIINNISSI